MGLLQDISGFLSPAWDGLKAAVSTPFSWIKTAAKKVGDFSNTVDRWLQNGQNDSVLGQAASAVYNSPIYRGIQDVIRGGVGIVDDVDRIGGDIANIVDNRLGDFAAGRPGANSGSQGSGGRPDMRVSPIDPGSRGFGVNSFKVAPIGRMRA